MKIALAGCGLAAILCGYAAQAQLHDLPYQDMPKPPVFFTAEAVAAYQIDALGFRYRWATEGLRPEDLAYAPSPGARTCEATLTHVLDLAGLIYSACLDAPAPAPGPQKDLTTLRSQTLPLLQAASASLQAPDTQLERIRLKRGDAAYPYWTLIHGPVSDALWHCGQVASFRRASGNPIPGGINFFSGKGAP